MSDTVADRVVEDPVIVAADPMIEHVHDTAVPPVHGKTKDESDLSNKETLEILSEGVVELVKPDASNDDVLSAAEDPVPNTETNAANNDVQQLEPVADDVVATDHKEMTVAQAEISLEKTGDAQSTLPVDLDSGVSDAITADNFTETNLNERSNGNASIKEVDVTTVNGTETALSVEREEPANTGIADTAEENTADKSLNDSAIEIPPPTLEKKEDGAKGDDTAPADRSELEGVEAENPIEATTDDQTNVTDSVETTAEETNDTQQREAPAPVEAAVVEETNENVPITDTSPEVNEAELAPAIATRGPNAFPEEVAEIPADDETSVATDPGPVTIEPDLEPTQVDVEVVAEEAQAPADAVPLDDASEPISNLDAGNDEVAKVKGIVEDEEAVQHRSEEVHETITEAVEPVVEESVAESTEVPEKAELRDNAQTDATTQDDAPEGVPGIANAEVAPALETEPAVTSEEVPATIIEDVTAEPALGDEAELVSASEEVTVEAEAPAPAEAEPVISGEEVPTTVVEDATGALGDEPAVGGEEVSNAAALVPEDEPVGAGEGGPATVLEDETVCEEGPVTMEENTTSALEDELADEEIPTNVVEGLTAALEDESEVSASVETAEPEVLSDANVTVEADLVITPEAQVQGGAPTEIETVESSTSVEVAEVTPTDLPAQDVEVTEEVPAEVELAANEIPVVEVKEEDPAEVELVKEEGPAPAPAEVEAVAPAVEDIPAEVAITNEEVAAPMVEAAASEGDTQVLDERVPAATEAVPIAKGEDEEAPETVLEGPSPASEQTTLSEGVAEESVQEEEVPTPVAMIEVTSEELPVPLEETSVVNEGVTVLVEQEPLVTSAEVIPVVHDASSGHEAEAEETLEEVATRFEVESASENAPPAPAEAEPLGSEERVVDPVGAEEDSNDPGEAAVAEQEPIASAEVGAYAIPVLEAQITGETPLTVGTDHIVDINMVAVPVVDSENIPIVETTQDEAPVETELVVTGESVAHPLNSETVADEGPGMIKDEPALGNEATFAEDTTKTGDVTTDKAIGQSQTGLVADEELSATVVVEAELADEATQTVLEAESEYVPISDDAQPAVAEAAATETSVQVEQRELAEEANLNPIVCLKDTHGDAAQSNEGETPEAGIEAGAEVVLEGAAVMLATAVKETPSVGLPSLDGDQEQTGIEAVQKELPTAEFGPSSADVSEPPVVEAATTEDIFNVGQASVNVSNPSISDTEEIIADIPKPDQEVGAVIEEGPADITITDPIAVNNEGGAIHVLKTELLSLETSVDFASLTPVLDSGIEIKEQESEPSQLFSIAEETEKPKSLWSSSLEIMSIQSGQPQGDEVNTALVDNIEREVPVAGTNIPGVAVEDLTPNDGVTAAAVSEDVTSAHAHSLEPPARPWTPSYSVHSQGSPAQRPMELVEDVTVAGEEVSTERRNEVEKQCVSSLENVGPVQATVVEINKQATSVSPVTFGDGKDTNETGVQVFDGKVESESNVDDALDQTSKPWTSSYSVHSQGSPLEAARALETVANTESADSTEAHEHKIEEAAVAASILDSAGKDVPLKANEVASEPEKNDDAQPEEDIKIEQVIMGGLTPAMVIAGLYTASEGSAAVIDDKHHSTEPLSNAEAGTTWGTSTSVDVQKVENTDYARSQQLDSDSTPAPIPYIDQSTVSVDGGGPDTDASDAIASAAEQPEDALTPSCSVKQGAELTKEEQLHNLETLPQSLSQPGDNSDTDPHLNEVQENDNEMNAMQPRAAYNVMGAEDLGKNDKFFLFGLRALVAYLWVLPKWLNTTPTNHSRRESGSSASSSSSKFFPGGWFAPKPNEGHTSLDVAQGEFTPSTKAPMSSDVFGTLSPEATEAATISSTAADVDDGQKRKWCIVM